MWSHIITWCSQGGKLSFANTLCTFKLLFCTAISLMSVEHIIWDLIKWIEAVWVFKHFHIFQRGLSFNSYEVIYLWGVDNGKMIEQMCDTHKNNYVYVGWPLCCHLVSVYVGWPLLSPSVSLCWLASLLSPSVSLCWLASLLSPSVSLCWLASLLSPSVSLCWLASLLSPSVSLCWLASLLSPSVSLCWLASAVT